MLLGCAGPIRSYREVSSLKSLTLGEPKAKVLETFNARDRDAENRPLRVEALRIRGAERLGPGERVEVGEVPLIDKNSGRVVTYWFLFKNDRLAMWGRAEDWATVEKTVPIHYTPSEPTK
jgi:hypothetical protein